MKRLMCAVFVLFATSLQAQDLVEKAPGQFWSTSQLGLSRMCSDRTPGLWVTMLLDRHDPNNQQVLARSQDQALGYGECADFFVSWSGNECIQRDVFFGIPVEILQRAFTYNEVKNYEIGGDNVVWNVSSCTPIVVPPPPTPPPVSCVPPIIFSFGGSPSIARFPVDYQDPWLPSSRGPYFLYVPAGTYDVEIWTGDNHIDTLGITKDGPQRQEIGNLVSGDLVIGPTLDVPDWANNQLSVFRVTLIEPMYSFLVVHAGTGEVTEPTDSFYFQSVMFTCVP